jgi:L-ascorbate metabolism protein UlaG (beta-lactamase superfamily)
MRLTKYGHSCLLVEEGPARMLLDPGTLSGGFEELEGLTAVLVTHQHADHLDLQRLRRLLERNPGVRVIHPDIPVVPNVGYLLGGRLFHPGDSFTLPGQPIEVLAVPAGAPWLKVSEPIDYLRQVRPQVAVPVHELVLSAAGKAIHYRQLEQLGGTTLRVLDDGRPVEL